MASMETGTLGAARSDRFGIDDSAACQADTSAGEAPTPLPDTPDFSSSVVTRAGYDPAATACTDVPNILCGRERHGLLECQAWPHCGEVSPSLGISPRFATEQENSLQQASFPLASHGVDDPGSPPVLVRARRSCARRLPPQFDYHGSIMLMRD